MDPGRAINRRAYLGSQIITLTEQILAWEKQARKTPPKTLKVEWEKVRQAKVLLETGKARLADMKQEQEALSHRISM